MNKVLVFSQNEKNIENIQSVFEPFSEHIIDEYSRTLEESIQFLNYEYPELIIIDFSGVDNYDSQFEFIQKVNDDPWLHYSGIVTVYSRKDNESILEKIKGTNIVGLIESLEIPLRLPSVVKIFSKNTNLIFQRELQQTLMKNITGEFIIENDPFEANVYASLLANYLFYSNYIQIDRRDKVRLVFIEMIQNAIEHGNCQITFEEKTRLLMDGKSIMDIIEERNSDPKIAEKKVVFSYKIKKDSSSYSVRDEGEGFDWKSRIAHTEEVNERAHGRGIKISHQIVDNLHYNDKGNEVFFDISHNIDRSNLIPQIFIEKEELDVKKGDTIFQAGEISNFLYYIVSGNFEVSAQSGKKIALLTPNDIFIGELAFLLSNKRTATVKAVSDGMLIKISKREFVDSIKRYPYYGLFLSRLLAQKIEQMNQLQSKN